VDSRNLSVLFEDNHLLVVNKPAGILVQADATGDTPLVEMAKEYISKKYQKPGAVFLGVVHRLDRPVSGVVVFARTSKSLERMNSLFRNRETLKTYWAVVSDKPEMEEGLLVHWLVKDERKNKTTAFIRETPDGQRSELKYRVLASAVGKFLLEVNPVTGRSHQIRVQLARMGCPILGDLKYGADAGDEETGIGLHSRRLEFVHPVKKEHLVVQANPPHNPFWEPFGFLYKS
jgi:23S rRNA pseudouridine1911/1915/1917 synthase